jgi:hypothetical protein
MREAGAAREGVSVSSVSSFSGRFLALLVVVDPVLYDIISEIFEQEGLASDDGVQQ